MDNFFMSKLTPEQDQALNEFLALIPKDGAAGLSGAAQTAARSTEHPDMFQTWLGISAHDLRAVFQQVVFKKDILEGKFLNWFENNPMDAAFEFLVAASWGFYLAEKDVNPKIETFIDAFYYISTCASVGYADIFAATQTGRTIAALVMILGPALTNKAMDHPAES
jgi:hypothetical protein